MGRTRSIDERCSIYLIIMEYAIFEGRGCSHIGSLSQPHRICPVLPLALSDDDRLVTQILVFKTTRYIIYFNINCTILIISIDVVVNPINLV